MHYQLSGRMLSCVKRIPSKDQYIKRSVLRGHFPQAPTDQNKIPCATVYNANTVQQCTDEIKLNYKRLHNVLITHYFLRTSNIENHNQRSPS